MDRHGPELSDVVVDYDPVTLARRPIRVAEARARARELPARARRILESLPVRGDVLDDNAIDGVLVRSHLELQRLHEEFLLGEEMRIALAPIVAALRVHAGGRPLRVVDLGCGLGYVLRHLSAHGALGDDVELIGVDYNRALVAAASELASRESLRCRFAAGNAFALDDAPADVVISTGVLHHFRGDDLARVFAEHAASSALAFVHLDIRPWWMASLGSWVFHAARMREPLARFDGYWSAVRAHTCGTLCAAAARGAPGFALATLDARFSLKSLVRIMHGVVGVRRDLGIALTEVYRDLSDRVESV